MEVNACTRRRLLEPCILAGYRHQLDTYIGCEHRCLYCYALNEAETDWSKEILIHQDLAGRLSHELSALEPQSIYMGWNSDPYQPAEATCRQTEQALKILSERGFSVCILTKSKLVTRDIDLLLNMPGSSAGISIAFADERTRRLFEANAPPNPERIQALKQLKEAGVDTYALICPVMPFITEVGPLIDGVAPHACKIWVYGLSMEEEKDPNWQNLRSILKQHFPELTEHYRQIAFSTAHPYWGKLRRRLAQLRANRGLDIEINL